MKYLLDADAVTFLFDDQRKPQHEAIHRRISDLRDGDSMQTSVLVLCELEYGYFNAPDDKKAPIRATIDSISRQFDDILPLEPGVAGVFGGLKAHLRAKRRLSREAIRRHNVDLLLAATAVVTSAVLVGADRLYAELAEDWPDFRTENWLEAS